MQAVESVNGVVAVLDGFGEVAQLNENGVVSRAGVMLAYGDMSQVQLRALAKSQRLGSGVWRAGAKKAAFVAAFGAVARGEEFNFEVAAPDPKYVAVQQLMAGGDNHKSFEALLRVVQARVPAYLVGPAGSGKSTAAKKVADALGLKFYSKSVCLQSTESSLMGYMDANGNYVRSQLREAFEFGGVFLLDEIDAGSPHVLVVLNSLLANGRCAFPDGMIEAHPDFRLVAGANTFGGGASREFAGRQQLDAATLDRFAFMVWSYDKRLERIAAGLNGGRREASEYEVNDAAGSEDSNERAERWLSRVFEVRKAVEKHSVRHMVTPRASIYGRALLDAGLSWKSVEDLLLKKGLPDDVWAKISVAA
jgi:cobaltochelatase CobS